MKKILSLIIVSLALISGNANANAKALTVGQWFQLCEEDESVCFLIFASAVTSTQFSGTFLQQKLNDLGKPQVMDLYCVDSLTRITKKDQMTMFKNAIRPNQYKYPFGAMVPFWLRETFPSPC